MDWSGLKLRVITERVLWECRVYKVGRAGLLPDWEVLLHISPLVTYCSAQPCLLQETLTHAATRESRSHSITLVLTYTNMYPIKPGSSLGEKRGKDD